MEAASSGFQGLRVLTLESRRAVEQATLISRFGGQPMVAPALREIPPESETNALAFLDALMRGAIDVVVLLTGAGTRALAAVADSRYPREAFVAALGRTRIVARGPKPVAALRELGLQAWVVAPEPNTWRELVASLDAKRTEFDLRGARVALQEYGAPNPELVAALEARGAILTPVRVYQWALPEDVGPLEEAARAIARGDVDVIVLTSSVQLAHLWQIAERLRVAGEMGQQLAKTVIASIGPTTSEEIRRRGLEPDLEPAHPKMGQLITEAAARSPALLAAKRSPGADAGAGNRVS